MYLTRQSTNRGGRVLALTAGMVCLIAFGSSFFVNEQNSGQASVSSGANANTHTAIVDFGDPQTRPRVRKLLKLMNDRIALMHDVARWKYNNHVPVADLEREKAILVRVAEQKLPANLNSAFVVTFFQAQMDVAKAVQTKVIQNWEEEKREPFVNVPDLKTEVRLQISELSQQILNILNQLAADRPNLQLVWILEVESDSILADDLLTSAMRQEMIRPLVDLFSTPKLK